MCDSKGVIYKGRKNIDQFKSAFAIETKLRTLEEAMKNGVKDRDLPNENFPSDHLRIEAIFQIII